MSVMIIGVAGGTGSGKTTLTHKLKDKFQDSVAVVYHDNYYKRNDGISLEERRKINYDAPQAFDTELLIDDLRVLKSGKAIDCPTYDYNLHNRSKETIHIEPKKVIIVEGILVFENDQLRDLMDIKVFVDTDADERLSRRILRDFTQRGRTAESVITQYRNTVKPMHEKYVEPSKRHADFIVNGEGDNLVFLDMINMKVSSLIK